MENNGERASEETWGGDLRVITGLPALQMEAVDPFQVLEAGIERVTQQTTPMITIWS